MSDAVPSQCEKLLCCALHNFHSHYIQYCCNQAQWTSPLAHHKIHGVPASASEAKTGRFFLLHGRLPSNYSQLVTYSQQAWYCWLLRVRSFLNSIFFLHLLFCCTTWSSLLCAYINVLISSQQCFGGYMQNLIYVHLSHRLWCLELNCSSQRKFFSPMTCVVCLYFFLSTYARSKSVIL